MIFVSHFIGVLSRNCARLADGQLLAHDLTGAVEARDAAARLVPDLLVAPAS